MNLSIDEQMCVLLGGDNIYDWAVAQGLIKYGDSLPESPIFTVTQRDAFTYFQTHPVPGIDIDVSTYQDISDGLKWRLQNGKYLIGWQERGYFNARQEVDTLDEFRTAWLKAFINSLGLLP